MAELYSTGVCRVMYQAVAFATGKTVTAYFWNPSLTKSGLQTFTEVELGIYYLDYNFTVEGTYLGIFFENTVEKASQVFRVKKLAVAGDQMNLANDAITAGKYDESTAYPVSEKASAAAATMVLATVVADGANSPTQFKTNLTESTDDHYKSREIIFRTGVMTGQATDILGYNGTTHFVTVTGMTETPPADSLLEIV